jgi:threonine synthase
MRRNMEKYFYRCFNCKEKYSSRQIEDEFIYLCPTCGKAEKNQPLKGVLQVEYDYSDIKRKLKKNDFLKLPCGLFWLYPDLWPMEKISQRSKVKSQKVNDKLLNKIKLTSDPYFELKYKGNSFSILDDTRNPTLSFKDRASALVALKAIQLGVNEIAAASTGNAGSSIAGICSRLGLKSHIFVPERIPEAKRIQIQSYGAKIYLVKGDYDQAFDLCLEFSAQKKWYNRNTAYNPLTIEGKKSAAFDIFISTKGKIPDVIFVPTGDGVIIAGIYKGFLELKKLGWIDELPKLMAVQAKGSNAFLRYVKTNKFNYKPAHTIADSISAGAPRNLYMAADSILESKGSVIEVSDKEIIEAQKFVAQEYGLIIEPSSASGFAAYQKFLLMNDNNLKSKIMLLFTGNGLKDVGALSKWNKVPVARTTGEWKKLFNV